MTTLRNATRAFGHPGIPPRWTRGGKSAVGTAYSRNSRIWYTAAAGVLTEIYYPTLDRPQTRDLQFLVSDGKTFFHDERRHTTSTIRHMSRHSLGLRMVNEDREGRYRLTKEVIAHPDEACLLIRTRFEPAASLAGDLALYVLLAPHLGIAGRGNTGNVAEIDSRTILTAHHDGTWLSLVASVPFKRASCGYVGHSDGWTDLAEHLEMSWQFDTAPDGNIALTGEFDLASGTEFTLALAFGNHLHDATTTAFQCLGQPFSSHRRRFNTQWNRACRKALPLDDASTDGGRLYHTSHGILRAHEDKTYPGAMIASLSIPWGDVKGDEDLGGYHLVWPRDMVNTTTALLASGDTETPLRALIYLAVAQRADGGFNQNFWLNGDSYWQGIQLDEVAFPVMLAWRLHEMDALSRFDPYPMVLKAAGYMIREGPATQQERWEENSGYSPSTLAVNIAALTCASLFAHARGEHETATYLEDYADFLSCHVESWTVTTQGTLLEGVPRHFIRIHPVDPGDSQPDENPDHGMLRIKNRLPGTPSMFPAREVVDAGFLELVRYGVRSPGDPLIEDSLRVIDAVLKVDLPQGPVWRRYNHDGYGEGPRGEPFRGSGVGRGWPLLTGERAHYELAAGRDVTPFIRAIEGFANGCGLLPEQVWDEEDLPDRFLRLGGPTGAASPLCWAHAEYIKLLRSAHDGEVFDRIPAVAERYRDGCRCQLLEIWKFNRQVRSVRSDFMLRIQAAAPFRLRWTRGDWEHATETPSRPTSLGIHFADLEIEPTRRGPLRFTFFWPEAARWEGRDFEVEVRE